MSMQLIIAAVVSPLLIWAGTAAASIPIIIHLLSKRRFRRIRWAAMDFLLQADRQNRRRVRIEELILLALRCLAMFLIGSMLARWFIRPEALASLIGSAGRTERIVVIDDSYSMGLRDRGEAGAGASTDVPRALARTASGETSRAGTVFARANRAVDLLVNWLRQEAPGDPLTILLTSRPDRPLRVEPALGSMDAAAMATELESIAPSARAGNMDAAMNAVRDLLDARTGVLSAMVYVVSDFQRVDWTRGGPGGSATTQPSGGKSPLSSLAGWAGQDRSLQVVLTDVGIEPRSNLCVSEIVPQQAQPVAGVSCIYNIRIRNHLEAPSAPTTLHVYVGDAAQPSVAVPVVPGRGSVEVPVEVTFPNEGAEVLMVELEPDDLPIDNQRAASVPVARALRVLIVNGEPSPDPFLDEVFLLTAAVRPEGPQFSGNEVTIVDDNEFEATDLSSYHAVVLANVYRVSEEMASRLESYLEAGGGVEIFLGDQVDAEVYNRILFRDGKGLLPARLGEMVSAPADSAGFAFGTPDPSHPALKRFRDAQISYFQGAAAGHFFAAEPASIAATAPASRPNGGDAGVAIGPARVLMRFSDSDGHPALIERTYGAGRVLLITTSVDREWTNLPERPVYVVFAMEMLQYLARPPARDEDVLVGHPLRVALDPARYQPAATLKLPTFPEEPAVRLEAQPDRETPTPVINWARTDTPGVYHLELTEVTGGASVRPVAVNVDSRESDLHRATRAELVEAGAGVPVEYVSAGQVVQQRETQARWELWPSLLVALVTILMAEQALAWWFGSGRSMFSGGPG